MSDYAFVAERAKKANASIAKLERALLHDPGDRAARVNLTAMRKLAHQAAAELDHLASANHIDVCKYRIVPMRAEEYGLGPVSKALFEYQQLFTQIYDSFKNGAKANRGAGAEAQRESMLDFAYTYSGSLGVVLLAQSDRTFFDGSLDSSIDALYEVLDIADADDVRQISESRGRAVVSAIHAWSDANVKAGFAADVKWKRSDGRLRGQMITLAHLEEIAGIIDTAADEKTDKLEVNGMLVAGSLPKGSFQIAVPDGDTYSGSFHEDMERPEVMTLGSMYQAAIEVSDTYYYATDKHVRVNRLLRLSPLS